MTVATGRKTAKDKRRPQIRSEDEWRRAVEEVASLLKCGRGLTPAAASRLESLSEAVEDYEDRHHPIPEPSAGELVKHLLESRGSTYAQLAQAANLSRSTVSAIVAGRRKVKPEEARAFARFFRVDLSVFYADDPAEEVPTGANHESRGSGSRSGRDVHGGGETSAGGR